MLGTLADLGHLIPVVSKVSLNSPPPAHLTQLKELEIHQYFRVIIDCVI